MQTWKLYHFHDTSDSARVKQTGDINDNFFLRGDAGNLAAFLFNLKNAFSSHYEIIRGSIRQVVPFFDDFILRPQTDNPNKIRLEWREQGSDYPFLAHQLSDGTLRFICLAALLLQPQPPSTIVIDEPELGLHPFAIAVLASMMRSAAARLPLRLDRHLCGRRQLRARLPGGDRHRKARQGAARAPAHRALGVGCARRREAMPSRALIRSFIPT